MNVLSHPSRDKPYPRKFSINFSLLTVINQIFNMQSVSRTSCQLNSCVCLVIPSNYRVTGWWNSDEG